MKVKNFCRGVLSKIKGGAHKVHDKYRAKFPKKVPKLNDGKLHDRKFVLKLAIASILMNLYIETFARITSGVFDGVMFLFKHPIIFLYNCLIIFTTMCLALMFRKRGFAFLILCTIWGILGTVNGVILLKRMTPFTLYDLQNTKDGFSLLTTYYSKAQITLGAAIIGVALLIVVLYYINCYKWTNLNYKKELGIIVVAIATCFGGTFGLIETKALSTFFGNLNYAYRDYGFAYCFLNTSVNKGIRKPNHYSKKEIQSILENYTKNGTNTTLVQKNDAKKYPNIIILQLESFSYAQDYKNIKVSNDPTPNFTNLMKNYSTGWFKVPVCGAGTANTEFEVLTGISSRFFGPGEYPYKGKLREQSLESLGYVLKSHGYNTHAMHDHRALFYNRNEVYASLGFDNFTSLEYMNNIVKTPTGWAKDKVMTDDIMNIIKRSDTRDLLHIISVQGHGAYPTERVFKDPYTTVTAKDEATKWKYEYYVNELHEMDEFTGDLLKKIEESGEPTVVLIYGDHIPALDIKESEYGTGDLYQTRYVIWDNIGLKKKDKDITSYEVTADILKNVGLGHQGVIFDYEQTADKNSKDYEKNLKALAYDMLYGKNYVFGGKNPYKRTKMRMGYKKIKIDGIISIGKKYYIKGQNFTEHSTVSLDGKVLKTVYLSPTLLGLSEKIDQKDVKKLRVSQIDSKDETILSTIGGNEEL